MWGQQLRDYLDREGVRYITLHHSPAYTAQEIAASAHVPGREMAKTVIVKLDGKIVMAVLPASYRVVPDMLREATGVHDVELAQEQEFAHLFPGCEKGAMPPFGNLYGLEVYVADSLADDDEIAFNAGSFTQLLRMAYRDYERLVKPRVLRFATKV
jgi:Ala-tRNA(Pro) deacylase